MPTMHMPQNLSFVYERLIHKLKEKYKHFYRPGEIIFFHPSETKTFYTFQGCKLIPGIYHVATWTEKLPISIPPEPWEDSEVTITATSPGLKVDCPFVRLDFLNKYTATLLVEKPPQFNIMLKGTVDISDLAFKLFVKKPKYLIRIYEDDDCIRYFDYWDLFVIQKCCDGFHEERPATQSDVDAVISVLTWLEQALPSKAMECENIKHRIIEKFRKKNQQKLTGKELFVLCNISINKNLDENTLKQHLLAKGNLLPSELENILFKLLKRGYIYRKKLGMRLYTYALTPKGYAVLRKKLL